MNPKLLQTTELTENRESNQWLTYNQVSAMGGKINKGEHGTKIQFWQNTEKGPDGETVRLDKPVLKYSTVFNVAQTTLTNINAKQPERMDASEIIGAFNVQHDTSQNARPRYDKDADTITVPPPNRFPTTADYQRVVVEQIANRQESRYSNKPEPTPGTPDAAAREMKVKMAAAVSHISEVEDGTHFFKR